MGGSHSVDYTPRMTADPRALLEAYDAQLRGEDEVAGAVEVDRDGPLFRALFDRWFGFVGYRSLAGFDGPDDGARLDDLIERAIAHFAARPEVTEFEWKTRGHDLPADLPARLERHGFVGEELEVVVAGEAALLTAAPDLPAGVTLRRVGFDAAGAAQPRERIAEDVRRTMAMQTEAFGRPGHLSEERLVRDLIEKADRSELWIAEADGRVVSAGRMEIVRGTEFAGLWGGATLAAWRGKGIYRALTAARASAALAKGARYIQVDCSPHSRPILERAGLTPITTTTPYRWTRPA